MITKINRNSTILCGILFVTLFYGALCDNEQNNGAALEQNHTDIQNDQNDVADNKDAQTEDALRSGLALVHEIIIEQADQPSSGEQFVAVHIDAQAIREPLRPHLIGLANMAITFLPSSFVFVNVIAATRQVVAGVRYNILANVNDPNGMPIVCDIDVLEKPWIHTEAGDKLRILEYSNCTDPRYPLNQQPSDNSPTNRINPLFQNRPTELTADRLREIEAMIVPVTSKPSTIRTSSIEDQIIVQSQQQPVMHSPNQIVDEPIIVPQRAKPRYPTTTAQTPPMTNQNLNADIERSVQQAIDSEKSDGEAAAVADAATAGGENLFREYVQEAITQNGPKAIAEFDNGGQVTVTYSFPPTQMADRATVASAPEIDQIVLCVGNNGPAPVSESLPPTQAQLEAEDGYNQDQNQNQDQATHDDDVQQAQIQMQYTPIVDVQRRDKREVYTDRVQQFGRNALAALDAVDKDDFKRILIDVLSIEERSLGIDNCTAILLGVKIEDSHCVEESNDLVACTNSLVEGSTRYCSLEIHACEQHTNTETLRMSECLPKVRKTRSPPNVVGGASPVDINGDTNFKKIMQEVSAGMATASGDKYKNPKIVSATKQVVAGVLYKVQVEFEGDSPNEATQCEIEVWDRPWIKQDGREIKVHCPEKKFNFRQRRSLIYDRRRPDGHDNLPTDAHTKRHQFHKFKTEFNRIYANTLEHENRFRIFKQNLFTIEQLNRYEMGTATYGVTEFADFTPTEYLMRTGLRTALRHENELPHPVAEIPDVELPPSFDWRKKGVVSNVKNQGSCGSCWAFSVTGNIEGLHAIATGHLEEYSEQELLDCDTVDGACNGGLPDNAYKAIEQLGGLELESDYPYDARKGSCRFDKKMSHVSVKGAVDLPANETAMAQWLITNGPISIGLNANAMQFYRGGISHPWKMLCNHKQIDHGVLIVGYGVSEYPKFNKILPYWIVKNSWGSRWGEQGYYRVYRGDNTCGINSMASSAVLDTQ